MSTDDEVRELLLVMPRIIGRIKRIAVPDALRELELAPRHLSLLSMLLLDGPQTVSELAGSLGLAPTTVSLLVGDLSRKGVLDRREDEADRRRRIVDISDAHRQDITAWLAAGGRAWRAALAPLSAAERRMVVDTMLRYESASAG
ncbi:MarR family transcriptional regulator [Catenuloplanes sp. NPDC051500]|uniref:MarR family transcriptional regulator n=1 Tax=Catenuloplanes sp. NPDC051500 TaxID=3363959 RepID=UPI00379C581B